MTMKIHIAYMEIVCCSDLHWYPFTRLHNIITSLDQPEYEYIHSNVHDQ